MIGSSALCVGGFHARRRLAGSALFRFCRHRILRLQVRNHEGGLRRHGLPFCTQPARACGPAVRTGDPVSKGPCALVAAVSAHGPSGTALPVRTARSRPSLQCARHTVGAGACGLGKVPGGRRTRARPDSRVPASHMPPEQNRRSYRSQAVFRTFCVVSGKHPPKFSTSTGIPALYQAT